MNIRTVNKCQVCGSTQLIENTCLIEEDSGFYSEKLCRICKECDTIHYIDNNMVMYEFSMKVNKIYKPSKIEQDELRFNT